MARKPKNRKPFDFTYFDSRKAFVYTDEELAIIVANIDTWLEELTKPRRQAKDVLQKGRSYCCLGIACRFVLNLKSEIADEIEPIAKRFFGLNAKDRGETSVLPGDSYYRFGLFSESGDRYTDNGNLHPGLTYERWGDGWGEPSCIDDETKTDGLTGLNDTGFTFIQIRERLLVDLRTDGLGFFRPQVRKAWRQHHGFTY